MKSIGISEGLPDYLKSVYSVHNPTKRAVTSHKAYKVSLRQGVSAESPIHFQVAYVPVVDTPMKNKAISSDLSASRFSSSLKKNNPNNKPRFNHSEIKDQTCDFDTLRFTECLDFKAGLSPRVCEKTGYSHNYFEGLKKGFGLPRGEFNVETAQKNVKRYEYCQFNRLTGLIGQNHARDLSRGSENEKGKVRINMNYVVRNEKVGAWDRVRKRKNEGRRKEAISLMELDSFDKEFAARKQFWKYAILYKDY